MTQTILVLDKTLLEKVFLLRHEVFVLEQKVPPELERDEEDPAAFHVAVLSDAHEVVGAGRLVVHGEKGKIGRMAVKAGWRGKGLGGELLKKLIEVGKQNGVSHFYLHAQTSARAFYLRHGFVPVGDLFEEAGIVHQKMELSAEG